MIRIAASTLVVASVLALAACSAGVAGPAGWKKTGPEVWTSPTGERYAYVSRKFDGTISDLASQVATDMELSHRGARLLRSDPIAACPAQAAIATFVQGTTTIEQAFGVIDNRSITIAYSRPSGAPAAPAATAAMEHTLCAAPL